MAPQLLRTADRVFKPCPWDWQSPLHPASPQLLSRPAMLIRSSHTGHFMLFKPARHMPASGSLHLLAFPSGTIFPSISTCFPPTPSSGLCSMSPCHQSFPEHAIKSEHHHPLVFPMSIYCLLFSIAFSSFKRTIFFVCFFKRLFIVLQVKKRKIP